MLGKKPLAVKIVLGLIIFKLIFILLYIGLFYLAFYSTTEGMSLLTGIREAFVEILNFNSTNIDYEFGLLVGKLLIPILLSVLTLIFLVNRKFWLTIFIISIDILVGLSQGTPLLPLILFIMVVLNPTRNYLKNTNTQ